MDQLHLQELELPAKIMPTCSNQVHFIGFQKASNFPSQGKSVQFIDFRSFLCAL